MHKSFLVTVSDDIDQLFGVKFLSAFFNKMSEHQVTLFHICRLDCSEMNKTLQEMWAHPEEKISGKLTVGGKRAIDKATEILSESKMSVDRIITKTVAERFGKVKDILTEGQEGLYDAIILGRRAGYTLQWVIERPADEIAKAVLKDSAFTTPIWICPEQAQGRQNVLVCVDGSENSFRAVDHTGYILSRQKHHAITLFYVENGSGKNSDEIFKRAKDILSEHQIEPERISEESTWGVSVPSTISSKAANGKFAAVALGLRGDQEGFMKSMKLAGGTVEKLVNKLEGTAIWCCP